MNKSTFDAMAAQYKIVETGKNLVDMSKAETLYGVPLETTVDGVVWPAGNKFYFKIPCHLPVGTYTVSAIGQNDVGEYLYVYTFCYEDGSYGPRTTALGKPLTSTADIAYIYIYKDMPTTALTDDLVVTQVQCEAGSTATDYEPYTGGNGEPVYWDNGVHCVMPEVLIGGKAEQTTYTGKNLFNKDDETAIVMCQILSEAIATSTITTAIRIPCDPNTTYSAQKIQSTRFTVYTTTEYPTIGIAVSLVASTTNTTMTFTTPDNAAYILILVHHANYDTDITVQSVLESIQIELGSVVTSYEPYTGCIPAPNPLYPIEPVFSNQTKILSRGKNLLNLADIVVNGDNYGSVEIRGDNVILSPPDSGKMYGIINRSVNFLNPGETYTFCVNVAQGTLGTSWGWRFKYVDGSYSDTFNREVFTLTPTQRVSAVMFYVDFGTQQYDTPFILSNLQIVAGAYTDETMPPYIPYFDGGEAVAPELLAIPGTEYRDEWDAQTGRGLRKIYKLVLDGDEHWRDDYLATYKLMVLDSTVLYGYPRISPSGYGICNCGGWIGPSNQQGTAIAFGNKSNPFVEQWGIDNDTDWKTYLSKRYAEGNPVIIWYPMADPVEFQTDPQPLIQSKGYTQLIQVDGTLSSCPITAKYVTHS